MGRVFELTCPRGCIYLGIHIDATVEHAIQSYRRRRHHRVETLLMTENEISKLRTHGLSQEEDVCLWRGA